MCKASHWPHYLSTLLFYSPSTPVWVNHPHILSVFQLPSLFRFITASLLSPLLFLNLNFSLSRSVFALSVLFLLTFACFSKLKMQGRLYKVLSFPGTRREFDSQTPDEEYIVFLYCCLDSVPFSTVKDTTYSSTNPFTYNFHYVQTLTANFTSQPTALWFVAKHVN